jgi:hypothetical protein
MAGTSDDILYLSNRHDPRHQHSCCCPPDFECRARMPRKTLQESTVTDDGFITLKKTEGWMNTFNGFFTYFVLSNTDVTPLLSGTALKAVIAYVTNYITKPALKTHAVFETIRSVYGHAAVLPDFCNKNST